MKWGIIGTGNMGTILIEAWLDSGVIDQEQLYITNRTIAKAQTLKEQYEDINVCSSPEEVASNVDLLYICVKPLDINPLLMRINPYLTEKKGLISITSPYSVEKLEENTPCQVARLIPSITNRALSGVTLLTFGSSMELVMRAYIRQSCKLYSRPIEIDESITRVSSDIVSCGPAFFSYLIQKFVLSAVEETNISWEKANELATEMFIGIGKLLEDGYYTLPTLQGKVCVKGGVTGEGIKVLEAELGEMFNHLFQKTHAKYKEDKIEIAKQHHDSKNE